MFTEDDQGVGRGGLGDAWSPCAARDPRASVREEAVAQYWLRCLEPRPKIAANGSSTTLCSSHPDEDDDEEEQEVDAFREEDDDFDHNAYDYYQCSRARPRRPSRFGAEVSGLPLVCSNCGVSFFSLRTTDDELECYCSGECKWSVIMYREMDRRMYSLRGGQTETPRSYMSAYSHENESYSSSCQYVEEVVSCR